MRNKQACIQITILKYRVKLKSLYSKEKRYRRYDYCHDRSYAQDDIRGSLKHCYVSFLFSIVYDRIQLNTLIHIVYGFVRYQHSDNLPVSLIFPLHELYLVIETDHYHII